MAPIGHDRNYGSSSALCSAADVIGSRGFSAELKDREAADVMPGSFFAASAPLGTEGSDYVP